MTAHSRHALTAALAMGAAVFAWPAQAFVCEVLPYQDQAPFDGVSRIASDFARQRIARMQSIFLGRVVSAEYAPFQDRGGAYVLSYEVSRWFKERGGPYARILQYDQREENCPAQETVRGLISNQENVVVFVDGFRERFPFAEPVGTPSMERAVPAKAFTCAR